MDRMMIAWWQTLCKQHFHMHFPWMKMFVFYTQISLKFVPKYLIHNKSALVQVMGWCQTGNRPLPEPMSTKMHDVSLNMASLGHNELTLVRSEALILQSCSHRENFWTFTGLRTNLIWFFWFYIWLYKGGLPVQCVFCQLWTLMFTVTEVVNFFLAY